MGKSESIAKLAAAMVELEAVMPPTKMNSMGHQNNKFADLGALIENLREQLHKFGLSYTQFPASEGDRHGLYTIIMHDSGEYIDGRITVALPEYWDDNAGPYQVNPVTGELLTFQGKPLRTGAWRKGEKGLSPIQVVGKDETYLRRYSLGAVFAMYGEEDLDGWAPVETENSRRTGPTVTVTEIASPKTEEARPASATTSTTPTNGNGHEPPFDITATKKLAKRLSWTSERVAEGAQKLRMDVDRTNEETAFKALDAWGQREDGKARLLQELGRPMAEVAPLIQSLGLSYSPDEETHNRIRETLAAEFAKREKV